jgi:hypothetical protein
MVGLASFTFLDRSVSEIRALHNFTRHISTFSGGLLEGFGVPTVHEISMETKTGVVTRGPEEGLSSVGLTVSV